MLVPNTSFSVNLNHLGTLTPAADNTAFTGFMYLRQQVTIHGVTLCLCTYDNTLQYRMLRCVYAPTTTRYYKGVTLCLCAYDNTLQYRVLRCVYVPTTTRYNTGCYVVFMCLRQHVTVQDVTLCLCTYNNTLQYRVLRCVCVPTTTRYNTGRYVLFINFILFCILCVCFKNTSPIIFIIWRCFLSSTG